MATTHRQGAQGSSGSAVASVNVTLGSTPITGNLLCVAIYTGSGGSTSITVKDGNNNSYVIGTGSPFQLPAAFGSPTNQMWYAYMLNAPSNSTSVITITPNVSDEITGYVEEFNLNGATASFDQKNYVSTASGTTITTPSLTPTVAASNVLYSLGGAASGQMTHPTAGEVVGVWTGSAAGINVANGMDAEYVINASGLTAVNYTYGTAGVSAAFLYSITITPPGGPPPSTLVINDSYEWIGGSSN